MNKDDKRRLRERAGFLQKQKEAHRLFRREELPDRFVLDQRMKRLEERVKALEEVIDNDKATS